MKTVKMAVEGMHCGACVSRVESALRDVDGVNAVEVSLDRSEASVTASDDAEDGSLVQAVEEVGYTASLRSE